MSVGKKAKPRKPRKHVGKPVEIETTRAIWSAQIYGSTETYFKVYEMDACTVMVGWTNHLGWHLSIDHPSRYPTWDEIAHARYKLLPDKVEMGLPLPPSARYVNESQNCFHLWESPVRGRPYIPSTKPEDYDQVTSWKKDMIAEQIPEEYRPKSS